MSGTSIRRATTADLADLRQLITDAYEKYIGRIRRPPAPMTADYAAALEHSRVWVLEDGDAIVGALVTEDRGETTSCWRRSPSRRAPREAAMDGCCSSARSATRSNSVLPRCGCTPTRR